jgi:hypothetical protein
VTEPLGSQVPPFAEPELDHIPVAVDGTVQVHPLAAYLDISLIDLPFSRDRPLAPIELLQQERLIVNGPAMDCSAINGDTSFGHRLLKIAEAEAVSEVPPHLQQVHRAIEMGLLNI